MHLLLRRLIDEPLEPAEVASALSAGLDVVVVTNKQSDMLPDAGTAEERYRAAGINFNDFRSLDDWPPCASAADSPRPGRGADRRRAGRFDRLSGGRGSSRDLFTLQVA